MATKKKIVCQTCGKEKIVIRYWAKFCSARCRLIAWAKGQGK